MAKAKKKKAVAKKKAVRSVAKKAAKKKVQPIPAKYSAVMPTFRVRDCKGAIDFLVKAFGGKLIDHYEMGGVVVHGEIKIGDVVIMCGEAHGGDVQTLAACLYVKNVDHVFAKAVSLGARVKQDVQTQFYGDRSGRFIDSWGNEWVVATHVEDVSKKEMAKRMAAMQQQGQQQAA